MISGLLVLNKPVGPTSFQVIARLRRITGIRKIGHAGTLDPLASGVLPICIGRAVRLAEYLQGDDKIYRAEITLGIRTTTDDAEGEVLTREAVTAGRAELEAILPEFTGTIRQVPPQYAAIKVGGKPMYELARKGKPVDAAPRLVVIERLTLLQWDAPRAVLQVECGKGTYVRALARDLGERLGCGAYLSALVRTRCGGFEIGSAVSLETLEAAPDWRAHLLPMDAGLQAWSRVELDATGATRIRNGLAVPMPADARLSPLARAYDPMGEFIAVLRANTATGELLPEKVFHDAGNDDPV